MKIKKGDNVIIIAGKDKGKTGTVIRALPSREQVLVEGVGVVARHQRTRRQGSQGQIIEKPMPIHVSNVALIDKKTKKAARVGYVSRGEGAKKIRVTRPSGEEA